MSVQPYILLMEPSIHERPWGGRRIAALAGKGAKAPPGVPVGESWEVSTHPNGISMVANGEYAGMSLADVARLWGAGLVGQPVRERHGGDFPLLVKLIELVTLASVQVHPDDRQAVRLEGYPWGKAEAWYIIDVSPGAEAYVGFRPGVDAGAFRAAVAAGRVRETLERVALSAGDCVLLPPGTVHACGNGIFLLEVQQSSDITYRVHDWDRLDGQGRRRELHLDKALEVIDFGARPVVSRGEETLVRSPYFGMDRRVVSGAHTLEEREVFQSLTVIRGALRLEGAGVALELEAGRTVLVPAGQGATLVGEAVLVVAYPGGGS